ncbi:MAG: hypothetical protein M1546_24025 [Chloroflexi bacterium]|nr:hypothetical protein [Chloroflexota bacterium]
MGRGTALFARLQYAFDKIMSAGPIALTAILSLLSLALVLVAALFLTVTGIAPDGSQTLDFPEAAWNSMVHTLDASLISGDVGWPFRVVMFVVAIGGLFVVSTFIGVLTSGIEGRLETLRKGRSFVFERDHTLILGWSPKIFTIISELVIANANKRRPRIVILADKDKVEMEDEIREKVGATGRTDVICRSGSPIDLYDLEIVNPYAARAIIILSPAGDDDPDSQVIKTILALANQSKRRDPSSSFAMAYAAPRKLPHIVAELEDPRNVGVARIAGGDGVHLLLARDVISRIMMQTCRESGLSTVYTELLNFSGNELYFRRDPALVGKAFAEVLPAYENAVPVGLCYAGGRVQLNPPMDTCIGADDTLIVLAADDSDINVADTVQPASPATVSPVDERAICNPVANERVLERTLILGWNSHGPIIINELDHYVALGSTVTVVADMGDAEGEIARLCGGLRHQTVSFQAGDTTERQTLEGLNIPGFNHVLILCYSQALPAQKADARTLITLLHLRDIARNAGCGHDEQCFSIVSEMLEAGNCKLAEVARADDFIVGDNLISLILAQVSENQQVGSVLSDLFAVEGSEIYLRPAKDYVHTGQAVNFYTLAEAACRRGEVAIGYRRMDLADSAEQAYGVVLNPNKRESITFSAHDRVIVLAES